MRKIKGKARMVTITGRVEEETYSQFSGFAQESDISVSALVGDAVNFYMYCMENEEEDGDIKDVLDKYYEEEPDNDEE